MSSAEIGVVPQETEVSSKARRRQFTAEYKRKVLAEADACTKPPPRWAKIAPAGAGVTTGYGEDLRLFDRIEAFCSRSVG